MAERAFASLVAIACIAHSAALAQTYPGKPVRLVVSPSRSR
jgi:tripartite-type tricarboxylate transporter receptor subunit TctC